MAAMGPSWLSDRNEFSYVLSISHLDASNQVSSLLAFRFMRRSEIDFQDGGPCGYLGLPIGTILDIFKLLVTPVLLAKFK